MKLFYSYIGRLCSYLPHLFHIVKDKSNKIFWPVIRGHRLVMSGRHFLVLCFVLFSIGVARSQSRTEFGAVNKQNITPLNIGDPIPDALWNTPLQVVNHPDGKETITLNDYKGKLIILDFWATWCPPCIKSLYKLDSIQRELKEDVVIIPITNEDQQKADAYFKARKWNLPTVVNSPLLHEHFPHKSIPHYIWVNSERNIEAITGHEPINRKNIHAIIKGEKPKMSFKNDLLNFDSKSPLFINGNGGDGTTIKYRSLFSEPISGLSQTASSVISDTISNTSRVYCINCQILMLYTIAYNKIESFPENRIKLDVKDSSKLKLLGNEKNQEEWLKSNTYCYELITPISAQDKVRERMAVDLNHFFGLNARFEKRITDCYILTALPDIEKSYSKGGNREDNLFDERSEKKHIQNNTMDALYGYLSEVLPLDVVNETNCFKTLDLQFPKPDKENLKPLQDALRKQGISLEKGKREIEFFIISDN
ncbi:TlpA family protein disulfide reductase [Sphingobacterium mizutaii]|uniref:TlpA family protein disulfide reductase n=1 Tax=Sphingobacterium mizutaii TaxID=1010 RepID=UPI00162397B2|nr:TlpA family protein disulfide reductase [Sphingobacterium mizutaii]